MKEMNSLAGSKDLPDHQVERKGAIECADRKQVRAAWVFIVLMGILSIIALLVLVFKGKVGFEI